MGDIRRKRREKSEIMKYCRSEAKIPQGGKGMSKRSGDPAELRGKNERMC